MFMANSLKDTILTACSSVAVIINFILIILIVFKSPKSLGSYKYLMIYIASFEMTYALLSVSEKPEIYTKKSAFFILVDMRKSIFPRFSAPFFDLLFVGFYGMTISLLAIHFIYRYLAMMKSPLLKSFQNWKIVCWMSAPIVNGVVWTSSGIVVFEPTEDSDRFMKSHYSPLLDNSSVSLGDLYYAGPFFYPPDANGIEYINWSHFAGSAVTMSLIMISFATMAYFGLKGYWKMRELMSLTNVSQKYQSIQAQLFYSLVFQTIIPVLLMHIPATLVYVITFSNCATEIVGDILTITIALYPAINPLPTMFIVKNYRKAISEMCIRVRYCYWCKPLPSHVKFFSTATAESTSRM